jgi:hypothetical protein
LFSVESLQMEKKLDQKELNAHYYKTFSFQTQKDVRLLAQLCPVCPLKVKWSHPHVLNWVGFIPGNLIGFQNIVLFNQNLIMKYVSL